ncbi:hypothetical protein [Pseudomonas sp. S2_F03]
MGIDVSVNTVKKMGASFDINVIKTKISNLQGVVRDSDVPVLDPPTTVTPPKIDVTPPKDGVMPPKEGDSPPQVIDEAKGIPYINRRTELAELFSSASARSGIQIGNRSLIELPNSGNAKIFSGATDVEIKQYFSELTGSTSLPPPRTISGKGDIYVVSTPEGNFTLRNFSSSSGQTGPAWTIDIPKAAAGTTYNPEIKFLIGNP